MRFLCKELSFGLMKKLFSLLRREYGSCSYDATVTKSLLFLSNSIKVNYNEEGKKFRRLFQYVLKKNFPSGNFMSYSCIATTAGVFRGARISSLHAPLKTPAVETMHD